MGHDIFGGIEEAENGVDGEKADNGHGNSDDSPQKGGHGDGLTEAVVVLSAEALGDQDREALGEAGGHPLNQPDDPFADPQCGEGLHPHHLADDDGIHHGVHLLEDVAQHQGQGEKEDELCGLPEVIS